MTRVPVGAFRIGGTLLDQTRRQAVRRAHDDVPALRCEGDLPNTIRRETAPSRRS
jgi:hypothetical protein